MADDTFYMKQALQEARKAFERGEVPVGAVVVCRDRIIARSHNLTEALNDVTAHAEMQAITAAANYLGGKYLAAGHYGGSQLLGRQVSGRVRIVCHGRALCDVCRCHCLGADGPLGLRRGRREKGVSAVCPECVASEDGGRSRPDGR